MGFSLNSTSWRTVSFSTLLHGVGFISTRLLAFPEGFHGVGFISTQLLAFPEGLHGVGFISTRLLAFPEGSHGVWFHFYTTFSFSSRTLLHGVSVSQDRSFSGLWWWYMIIVVIGILDVFHCLKWQETFWRLDLPLSSGIVLGLSNGPTKVGYSVFLVHLITEQIRLSQCSSSF